MMSPVQYRRFDTLAGWLALQIHHHHHHHQVVARPPLPFRLPCLPCLITSGSLLLHQPRLQLSVARYRAFYSCPGRAWQTLSDANPSGDNGRALHVPGWTRTGGGGERESCGRSRRASLQSPRVVCVELVRFRALMLPFLPAPLGMPVGGENVGCEMSVWLGVRM
ncbi:hypothetical protein K431DRAFT_137095 [Polychaeton citri CBS 116435]|uniref:Uncharacterized protein n=1 Tax=Polychaeton citri CBS 116435 TaxID=1314669 RepID=A0A9P4UMU5_9PEZI|nr:hypothetical protein K431DRAFT_137095 [Polychaeton citri CBS 116435]